MGDVTIAIIEVDLGTTVESIIQSDVSEVTAENRRHIDEAIHQANVEQAALDAVKAAKQKQDDDQKQRLDTLYAELMTASQESATSFLSSQRILSIAAPDMPNMISFVGRMRNWLKATNKPYKLTSKKKGKDQGYRLDPAPTTEEEASDAPPDA